MPAHPPLHTGDPCDCEHCIFSKKTRRGPPPYIPSPPETQPIVKGNNRYGAKGTIRCLACQRRKGKCEFPADKPDQPCEHCKRRGLRCGDKLPTERKRQLNQSQDDHPYVRQPDSSWTNSTTPSQSQYRYAEETRPYPQYANGVAPRPVAPAIPNLPEPRPAPTYAQRMYMPAPPIHRPPLPILFPQGNDLVRTIEKQIAKISLTETFAVARCLGDEHRLVGNPYISNLQISRLHQEFSRGDSWFNVQWLENGDHTVPRSIVLRFEPGRQICTSYTAEDVQQQQQAQQAQQHHHQQIHHQNIAPRQEPRAPLLEPMDVDPPKQMMTWPGYVGDLFDVAAGIVHDQGREKPSPASEDSPSLISEPSTALWPKRFWLAISAAIWGTELSKSELVYQFGLPNAKISVVVDRLQSLVGVAFGSPENESVDAPQFIDHAAIKRRISLKTLAKVLVQLSSKQHKPQSAGESLQLVEELVDVESTNESDVPNSRKRRFEEIDNDHEVKSERSMSSGSSLSGTTNNSSVDNVKMEFEPTASQVDEETSNAASILNGVALDHRPIDTIPPHMQPPMHYGQTYWSHTDQKGPPMSFANPNWSYNSATPETFR